MGLKIQGESQDDASTVLPWHLPWHYNSSLERALWEKAGHRARWVK